MRWRQAPRAKTRLRANSDARESVSVRGRFRYLHTPIVFPGVSDRAPRYLWGVEMREFLKKPPHVTVELTNR